MGNLDDRIVAFLTAYGGDGSGFGSGYGYGDGDGDGSGFGFGSGDGSGFGSGDSYGDGYDRDISTFCGEQVHEIDSIQTIIRSLKGNIAKGMILREDLTLKPCYVARVGDQFAHGETAADAISDATAKAAAHEPIKDRIARFWESHNRTDAYLASDLSGWHYILTGSCQMGRAEFMREHGIADDDILTVAEFVRITRDAYGGEIIAKLEEADDN